MAGRKGGAARWFTEQILGGPTRSQDTNLVVGTTSVVVAKNNPDRVGLVIQNIGSTDAFVGLSSAILSQLGIKLSALGTSMTLTVRDDFDLVTREFTAVTQSASTSIEVLEVIADIIGQDADLIASGGPQVH